MRDMYPGSVQAGLVLPRQLPLTSTWLSFQALLLTFFPPVELHPCLARSPQGLLSDHRRDCWHDTVSDGSNTQPHMYSYLQDEQNIFPPKFGYFPPSALLPPNLTQTKLMKEQTTHKIKWNKKTVRREQVQQRFWVFCNFPFANSFTVFSLWFLWFEDLVYDSCVFQPESD